MSVLLTRGTRLSQPQGPVEVDWANPIARKFSVILSGADWPTRNLANLAYQPTLLDGGVVSASVTAQGKTRLFSGQPTSGIGLDESCYVVAKESVSMTGPFTFFAWLRPSTFQQGNPDYITGIVSAYQQVSGTNNAPVMRFGGGAVAGTAKRLFVYANIGGVDRSILDSVDAVAGVTYFVVCTYDGAALKLWKNGALVGSVSCSGAVRTDAYTALTFLSDYQNISTGKAGNQPRGFSGDFILGGAAPYGVTSTEALSLYANPWQLFKPVQRRVWFDGGAAASGNSQTIAFTLDDITSSVSQTLSHSQSAAFTLDSISSTVNQAVTHSQSLSATLDDITASISQELAGAKSQSIAFTLDGIATSVSQTASHAQSLAVTLDDVTVAISQSAAPSSKDQSIAITLDDIFVDIKQAGPRRRRASGGKRNYIIKGKKYHLNDYELAVMIQGMLEEVERSDVEIDDGEAVKKVSRRVWKQLKESNAQLDFTLKELQSKVAIQEIDDEDDIALLML